ncbi:MAG: hypothetical protein ACJ8LN_09680, partial [Sulfurifustis sp.]
EDDDAGAEVFEEDGVRSMIFSMYQSTAFFSSRKKLLVLVVSDLLTELSGRGKINPSRSAGRGHRDTKTEQRSAAITSEKA